MSKEGEELSWKVKQVRGDKYHPLVDYIVLAEFDIDTGSTVRHQYPSNIPGYKVDWFAEFMLPEGAHNREMDYNYIFLNRDAPHEDQQLWSTSSRYRASSKEEIYSDPENQSKDQCFLYGINLVKTRYDNKVRRGAIVKAMCIFSRYQYIDILKKPLEIALDQYFDQSNIEILQNLYNTLNKINLSLVPKPNLLEQYLMKWGVCFDKISNTSSNYHIPMNWYYPIDFLYNNIEINLKLPIYRTPDEIIDTNLILLIKIFGDSIMRIYHGLLTKQRILFVGYNHPASEVGLMVLSAISMIAPPISSVIRRTFPYSNLSDLSFLEVII